MAQQKQVPVVDRVTREKEELDTKLGKLVNFLEGDESKGIGSKMKLLLGSQRAAMQRYSDVLGLRIAALKEEVSAK